jgi:hypothetical protein
LLERKRREKMRVTYHKGIQKSFEEIRHLKKFWRVTDIYIDEDGGIYYCVEEDPLNGSKV